MENSTMETDFWRWFAEFGIKPNEDISQEERFKIFNERVMVLDKTKDK